MKNQHIPQVASTSPASSRHHDHMRPREAAQYLGVSTSTLAKLRMRDNRDKGPAFSRPLGRFIVYRKADLDAWLEKSLVE